MNKKAVTFMPVFSLVIFIVLAGMFYAFTVNEKTVKEEIGFGDLQLELFNTYFEGEKDNYYYEKYLEYAIIKTNVEFKRNGGINEFCSATLEYGGNCEPDYEDEYSKLLEENLQGLVYDNFKLENNEIVLTLNKEYTKTEADYDYVYTKEIIVQKNININLEGLETLKSDIKTCLQNNEDSFGCLQYTNKENNILTYEVIIEPNFHDSSQLEFTLDLDNTGVITSIIS